MRKKFRGLLLEWFKTNHRPMPWKGEKDPYLIWLSEIILQQTRVEQGLPYFEKFKAAFPSVSDLAQAPEDEVFKLWEGLGYYSRARNLHFTAKHITNDLGGIFPVDYDGILTLKGVGPYTAAAIASFAYDLPHAVVDGNVYRVLSRCFGIHTPIDSTAGKKEFAILATEMLDKKQPGIYNQAIMDFGATQCVPKNPDCEHCPMKIDCVAYQHNTVSLLPIKEKKLKRRTRFFHYLILNYQDQVFINKRSEKDIWQGLYEFPLIEMTHLLDKTKLQQDSQLPELLANADWNIKKSSRPFTQQLTHQKIHGVFFEINLKKGNFTTENDWKLISRKNLKNYAFPKIIDSYLQDNSLYLDL